MTWLQKWNFKANQPHTHVLLTGGKISVPDEQHALFLNEYANATARGETLHMVECKTPVFRLFIDFDFRPPPPSETVDAAIRSACGVASYYFEADSRAIVLRKDVESDDKIGVHVTWDAVFVTAQTATAFRNHFVAKLKDACPSGPDWADVVDASVYAGGTGTGLRMPWSSKKDTPGVYVPVATCAPDGTLHPIGPIRTASAIRDWIRMTSIRMPGASPTQTCIVTSDAQEKEPATNAKCTRDSMTSYRDVLTAFHATLPTPYAHQQFIGMHRVGEHCVVLRSNSRKCGNKGYDQHRTNTVYFVVLRKGYAYQRCYCRKDTVREGGVTCTEYIGEAWPVPKDVIDGLWPQPVARTEALWKLMEKTRPTLKKRKVAKQAT